MTLEMSVTVLVEKLGLICVIHATENVISSWARSITIQSLITYMRNYGKEQNKLRSSITFTHGLLEEYNL